MEYIQILLFLLSKIGIGNILSNYSWEKNYKKDARCPNSSYIRNKLERLDQMIYKINCAFPNFIICYCRVLWMFCPLLCRSNFANSLEQFELIQNKILRL